MIELKKHFMDNDPMKMFSFKELWMKTGLDFDVFVLSKSIKKRIIESSRIIFVYESDEPFFKSFFKNDQQFILEVLPMMNVFDDPAGMIISTFADQIMFRDVGGEMFDKLYGEHVPLMYRIKMLIGAYEICKRDKRYSSIYILHWFCARIMATILPIVNIDEYIFAVCSQTITSFLEKRFGDKDLMCCNVQYEPEHFMKYILYDDSLVDWINPAYLFHENIFQLCLMSDPEDAVDKFVKKNAAIIRVINRCEPLFLEYLPKNIIYLIERVIWRWVNENECIHPYSLRSYSHCS